MSYQLRLTNIFRGDRSVEDYTREFLRLSRYAEDLMRGQYFAVTIYVTGLSSAFAGMPTEGLTLESVIELAKEIELRLISQGAKPNFLSNWRCSDWWVTEHTTPYISDWLQQS